MKVLVTGSGGQLGYDVCRVLMAQGIEHKGVDILDFDITDRVQTQRSMEAYHPDAVIHCSAWTAVDAAEDMAEKVYAVNSYGPRYLAEACKKIDAKMLYISTDYVFPGTGERFYQPDDPTGPLSVYGKSKLDGEFAVRELLDRFFIVRTSWVFGKNGNNFVKTMLKLAEKKQVIDVVADQIGSPTYTADLASLLCEMIQTDLYGVYHATNEGICSWAGFAQEIFRQSGKAVQVNPVPTSAYFSKAARPLNSRMSKKRLEEQGFKRLPVWQDALRRYLSELERLSDN